MNTLIRASFARSRTAMLTLLLILIAGAYTYQNIPKEADPDIQIPIIYVSMTLDGVTPEDGERLLVRPMEQALSTIEGVKEMTSKATQGQASVTLEFETGVDIDDALVDVREEVDAVRPDLPADADEPTVNEVNLALQPVLVVTLAGEVTERALLATARDLRDRLETLPGVLEVDIAGEREQLLEIIVDPVRLKGFGLQAEQIVTSVSRNNRLVAAGSLDSGSGRFAVKAEGLIETPEDLLALAVKTVGDRVITIADVAEVRKTFKDPEGFARMNGQPGLALEVKKRIGANIVETIQQVRAMVAAEQTAWPEAIEVGFMSDKSDDINRMLNDLQNNVLSAILLVMIVIVAFLGLRSASLVGFAVPGSFLAGILALGALGFTVNIVVLFALILAVGMLVDGAIVVVELADRKLAEGLSPRDAYLEAATRMAWPITASTATTLAAFLPLIFWPDIVGEFMKYLPITLVMTLTASLFMALIFVPNIGAMVTSMSMWMFGRKAAAGADSETARALSGSGGDITTVGGFTGAYVALMRGAIRLWWLVIAFAIVIAIVVVNAYGTYGRGVEFFPNVEPERAEVHIHARGDLSIRERDALVAEVESRILDVDGIDQFYTRSALRFEGDGIDSDTIGLIRVEFLPWDERRPAAEIMADIDERTADLAGVGVEVRKERAGPPVGKAVQIQMSSRDPDALAEVVSAVRARFDATPEFINISDSRPPPGVEWRIDIDRERAARFGADVATIGSSIQLVTNGVLVGAYRPDDAEDEVDIRARFSEEFRSLDQMERLVVNTDRGSAPLANFVVREPQPRAGDIARVEGLRTFSVGADVEEGFLADPLVKGLQSWLAEQEFDPAVAITFKGEDEEQQAAQAFLMKAFGVALFLIAIILVTQFNSFYQAFLILTAIVFSTVGVLLGLLITNQPFGIVMSGIGVIALAGIVVNNNIVLIDTYNTLRRRGLEPEEAILRTGAQRLRPVLLTTVTTILGLMPMVMRLSIDLFEPSITQGGPSTDWWAQLATAVAGGLAFATLLTLVLTPCLLIAGVRVGAFLSWLTTRRERAAGATPEPDGEGLAVAGLAKRRPARWGARPKAEPPRLVGQGGEGLAPAE